MKNEKWLIALAAGVGAAAAGFAVYKKFSADIPNGAEPVRGFDLDRFIGKWYEIARLPNRIEKNISELTDTYYRNADRSLTVITKGYNTKTNKWTEASGIIKPDSNPTIGKLSISYARPIYAAYNVLDIDENYQYALVSSSGLGLLWILSRNTSIPEDMKARFLYKAASIGFAIDQLEWQYGPLATMMDI